MIYDIMFLPADGKTAFRLRQFMRSKKTRLKYVPYSDSGKFFRVMGPYFDVVEDFKKNDLSGVLLICSEVQNV